MSPKSNRRKRIVGLPAETPDRRTRRSAETRERLFLAAMRIVRRKRLRGERRSRTSRMRPTLAKARFSTISRAKNTSSSRSATCRWESSRDLWRLARKGKEPMRAFFRTMSQQMTSEPAKKPDVMRALLQANLSSASVRNADAREECSRRKIVGGDRADRSGARGVSAGRFGARDGARFSADDVWDDSAVVGIWRRFAGGTASIGRSIFCGRDLFRARAWVRSRDFGTWLGYVTSGAAKS